MKKSGQVLAVTIGFVVASATALGQSGKIFDKTYNVGSGRPDLQVVVDDSSVRAESCGACREIHVHVDTRDMNLSDFQLQESQSGNLVRFSLKRPAGMHWNMGTRRQPEVTVSLPGEADVTLHSADGSLRLAGVSGRAELHSGDGAINASETRGSLRVAAGDGSVTLQRVAGTLSVTTGDGAIHGDGQFEQVEARSGDGSIDLVALNGSTLSNGIQIQSGDGSVRLRMPRSAHADLDLHAGDGAVRCDLPLARQDGDSGGHAVRGSLNGGGSTIRVRSGDGSITVSGQ